MESEIFERYKSTLTGANLYGANLTNADIRGANLEKANLVNTNCSQLIYDEDTILPSTFELR